MIVQAAGRHNCESTKASGRSGGLAFPERPHRQKRSWQARGIMPAVWLPMLPPPFCCSAQFRCGLRPGITGSTRRGGQFDRRLIGNIATALGALWGTNTARVPEQSVQSSSWRHRVSRPVAICICSVDVSIQNYKVNGIIHTNRDVWLRRLRSACFRRPSADDFADSHDVGRVQRMPLPVRRHNGGLSRGQLDPTV